MARAKRSGAKAQHAYVNRVQRLLKAHERRDDSNVLGLKPLSIPLQKPTRRGKSTRLKRLHDSLLGPHPVFPGTIIIPDSIEARLEDNTRTQDLESSLICGTAQVYWVDGSNNHGFLGAGVAWQEDGQWFTASHPLGPADTLGGCCDAELFAIAAALGQAQGHVQRGNALEIVKIFSDAMDVLERLRIGRCHILGPLLAEETALKGLYVRAHWLKDHNVRIELIWVKGHANSAGNVHADAAACKATHDQAMNPPPPTPFFSIVKTDLDVPQIWRDRGQDWIDEWLWRANRKHLAVVKKQGRNISKQLQGQDLVIEDVLQQKSLSDEYGYAPAALGLSADDYAARDLLEIRQAAIQAFYTAPSAKRVDSRFAKFLELRQKLSALLETIIGQSRYVIITPCDSPLSTSDASHSPVDDPSKVIADIRAVDEQIQMYQVHLVNEQDRRHKEDLEQKRLSKQLKKDQVQRGEEQAHALRQQRSTVSVSSEPEMVKIPKSEFLHSMGFKDVIETLELQSVNVTAENRKPTESWMGDELLQLLGEAQPFNSAAPKDRDRTPPTDRPVVRTLTIRTPARATSRQGSRSYA